MYIRITNREGKFRKIGTIRFSSINSQLGIEQSRRDDLESLGYVLIYFLNGSLPWQDIQIANYSLRSAKILELKQAVTSETFCKDSPGTYYHITICISVMYAM